MTWTTILTFCASKESRRSKILSPFTSLSLRSDKQSKVADFSDAHFVLILKIIAHIIRPSIRVQHLRIIIIWLWLSARQGLHVSELHARAGRRWGEAPLFRMGIKSHYSESCGFGNIFKKGIASSEPRTLIFHLPLVLFVLQIWL